MVVQVSIPFGKEIIRSWYVLLTLTTLTTGTALGDTLHIGACILGKVVSSETDRPIRAQVIIDDNGSTASTDSAGHYRLCGLRPGRYFVTIQSEGYRAVRRELLITSGRQIATNTSLQPRRAHGGLITVLPQSPATKQPHLVSSHIFGPEEINRLAATFQDPGRAVLSLPAFTGLGTSGNYLIPRSSSPSEVLWRLDDIEIPNPNHFGREGSSGGMINAINTDLIGESQIYTGALPARLGGKNSAAIDLKTRNGNEERHQWMGQFSFNGIEAHAEGPLGIADASSFLLSYRRSSLQVMKDIGLLDFNEIPAYDDLGVKLYTKINDRNTVSVTGLWGAANMLIDSTVQEDLSSSTSVKVLGSTWQYAADQYITRVTFSRVEQTYEDVLLNPGEPSHESINAIAASLFVPLGSRAFMTSGIRAKDIALSRKMVTELALSHAGVTSLACFAELDWTPFESLQTNIGIHAQRHGALNSVEPRFSVALQLAPSHVVSLGLSLTRQPQPLQLQTAIHQVLAYRWQSSSELGITLECYRKQYRDVGIHQSTLDGYSLMTVGFAEPMSFKDLDYTGQGEAYGVELSLSKQFDDGYFFRLNTSYSRQHYTGSDGIWRNGAFDRGLSSALIAGTEFAISKVGTLTLSQKLVVSGGMRYTPIDAEASHLQRMTIFDYEQANTGRHAVYKRLDLNADLTFNWSSSTMTVYLAAINALGFTNTVGYFYSLPKGQITSREDLPTIPVLGIRFEM